MSVVCSFMLHNLPVGLIVELELFCARIGDITRVHALPTNSAVSINRIRDVAVPAFNAL